MTVAKKVIPPNLTRGVTINITPDVVTIEIKRSELDQAIRNAVSQYSSGYHLNSVVDGLVGRGLSAYVKSKTPELEKAMKDAVDRKTSGAIKRIRIWGELTDAR